MPGRVERGGVTLQGKCPHLYFCETCLVLSLSVDICLYVFVSLLPNF